MRKVIILSFISLDGIIQAPGGPEEDSSGRFQYGGWAVSYFDGFSEKIMEAQMSGRSDIQTLLKNDLADKLWLKIFPVTLGKGKRLFAEGAFPAAFKLYKHQVSPGGVIFANNKRTGKVQTGSFS